MKKEWGSVLVGTRLEKMVENQFVTAWSHLIAKGLRPGDAFAIEKDHPAHISANELVRKFLRTDLDSICFLDSDWDGGYQFVEELRSIEDGWEFDIFQAFYPRRGWPPEAIWFKRSALGDLMQCLVWKDNHTEETALAGLHSVLIRREVFEKMLEEHPEIPLEEFDFFWYPRHKKISEDSAFCFDATDHGFRIGSTTKVKAGHISRVTTGWESYQEYIQLSGVADLWKEAYGRVNLVAEFLNEDPETVIAHAMRGSANVREGLERHGNPQSANELKKFYGAEDSGYFYDLLGWNNMPLYQKAIAPLGDIFSKTVLVVGGGIGGEVEVLKGRNRVVVFELPGALRDFLVWRYRDESSVSIWNFGDLRESQAYPVYDWIIAIDTLEHIHPDEFESTMDAMLGLLKPDGKFYFRNNFGQQEIYPMHFDHSEAYAQWIETNGLVVCDRHNIGVEILKREKHEEIEAA